MSEKKDITKINFTSVICLKKGVDTIYYAGRTDSYSYWCWSIKRCIIFPIDDEAKRTLEDLKKLDGHKRCFIEQQEEVLDSVPGLMYKQIKK